MFCAGTLAYATRLLLLSIQMSTSGRVHWGWRGEREEGHSRGTAHILFSLYWHGESFISLQEGLLAARQFGDPEANEGPNVGHMLLKVSALQYGSAGVVV